MPHTHEPPLHLSCQLPLLIAHLPRYRQRGLATLARDANLPKATVSRLVRGIGIPSYQSMLQLTGALEEAAGRRFDLRDLITNEPAFQRSACALVGCAGCLPPALHDARQPSQRRTTYAGPASY